MNQAKIMKRSFLQEQGNKHRAMKEVREAKLLHKTMDSAISKRNAR